MAIHRPIASRDKSEFMQRIFPMTDTQFRIGAIVEGVIVSVSDEFVSVDIGYRHMAMVSASEFNNHDRCIIGDKIAVWICSFEEDCVLASKKFADDKLTWERVLEKYVEGCVVRGTIERMVRGGLIVRTEDGFEAFLPGSQLDIRPIRELEEYLGKTYDFKVIKISNERRNLILSRRELLEAGWRRSDFSHAGSVMAPCTIPSAFRNLASDFQSLRKLKGTSGSRDVKVEDKCISGIGFGAGTDVAPNKDDEFEW